MKIAPVPDLSSGPNGVETSLDAADTSVRATTTAIQGARKSNTGMNAFGTGEAYEYFDP